MSVRILWLADALRAEGLRVVEVDGWKSRGEDKLVSLLHGVMFHHTATPVGVDDSAPLRVVTYGREGLVGPIANVMVGRDGTAYVIASGRANHAGEGGPWRTVPASTGNVANSMLFGLEVVNNGIGERWTETVLDAVDRVFAAVLKKIGKDETWCLGHKEWAPHRKIDPSLDMAAYRTRLKAYLEGEVADERFTLFLDGIRARRAGQTKNADWDNIKKLGYELYDDAVEFPKTSAHSHADYAPALHAHDPVEHEHPKHVHGEDIPVQL